MKLKTSLFKKGIFLNSIKRFGWIGILYFIVMFLTIPISIINTCGNIHIQIIKENIYYIERIFESPLIFLPMLIIPVFIGIVLFRDIQNKKTSDLIHSLPIRRETLFMSKILVGLILIILPVFLITLISTIILFNFGLSNLLYIVLDWMIGTIVFNIVFLSVSIFCGMISGISILQGVLTYIFLFLPYGLSTLIRINIKQLVYGFLYNYDSEQNIITLSPIIKMFNNPFTIRIYSGYYNKVMKEIVIYLVGSIIVIIASYYLYKLRKTESATKPITFNILKPIFKYGVTFSSMLLAGLIYSETTNSYSWMIFGYIIGSLLGYFIAEMIIKKSFYVFKNIKGYLIYAIAMVIIFTGFHFDITGFEGYIPNEEDIIAVSFNIPFDSREYHSLFLFKYDDFSLKSEENIKNIINTHKEVIKNKKTYKYYDGETRYLYLSYKLKSDKYVLREYKVPEEMYIKYTKDMKESVEYKKRIFKIFKHNANEIKKVNFFFYRDNNGEEGYVYKTLKVTDKNDIADLKIIFENEIINMKHDDLYNYGKNRISADIIYENNNEFRQNDLIPTLSMELIEKWLYEKGYLK